MELYVFAISHYSERGRWALDLAKQPYTLRGLTPGLHVAKMRALGAKATHVPLLQLDDRHIQGSDRILDWLAESAGFTALEPDPSQHAEALALEERMDRDIGRRLRTVLYDGLLKHERKLVVEMWTRGQPRWHTLALTATWPLLSRQVAAIYGCTAPRVTKAKLEFEQCWQDLEARLANQPYLLGDRFTRVDLTAAALLAPLVQPTAHPFAWPKPHPPCLAAFAEQYADRPLAHWAERIYSEHRTPAT